MACNRDMLCSVCSCKPYLLRKRQNSVGARCHISSTLDPCAPDKQARKELRMKLLP